MIPQVQAALNSILTSVATLRMAGGAGRAFELFVMGGVARALQLRSYDVWLQRSDGTRILPGDADRRFIQRGGAPTGIAGAAQGPGNAATIGFRFQQRPTWELWNGIQFEGRSGATHEIDLAIVPSSVGQALRAQPAGGRPLGRPRVAIECKDVAAPGSVDEMRAFVARLYDITLLTSHHPHLAIGGAAQSIHPGLPQNSIHVPALSYWEENRRTLNVIARRSGFVTGAAAMTGYHSIEPHAGIAATTTSAQGLFDTVADWIVANGY
ncbi:hypothetical protein [Pararhodobacter sp.]|jgi:hypothetical protein|uniref:hypothetical protein n=1 Tax=Pararhodobacter sp. TaxID=2127056 RepID=UPI002AFF6333|nr:hypothetical protein [Pararhodobacter sp.]